MLYYSSETSGEFIFCAMPITKSIASRLHSIGKAIAGWRYGDQVVYALIIFTTLTMPLFVDRSLVNAYVVPKQYWLAGLVLISLIALLVRLMATKKITVRYSRLDAVVLALILAAAVSAVFSLSPFDSWFGRGDYFTMNVVGWLVLAAWYGLIVKETNTAARWRRLVDCVIGAGGVTAAWLVLLTVPATAKLFGAITNLVNLIDPLNIVFGLWLVAVFMLAAGQMLVRPRLGLARTALYTAVSLLALAALVLLNFKMVWWILLGAIMLLLILGVSFARSVRPYLLAVLFALLLVAAVFIVFDTPRYFQINTPPALILNPAVSTIITGRTMLFGIKNFIIGSGPGTFALDFSRFRSADFNTDPVAWYVRFNHPFGSLFALLAEGGILLAGLFIALVAFVARRLLLIWIQNRATVKRLGKILGAEDDDDRLRREVLAVGLVWLGLSILTGAVFFGPVAWWLWWLLLGLLVSGFGQISTEFGSVAELSVRDTPEHNLAFSAVVIVLISAAVLGGAWGARWYLGEARYARALGLVNAEKAEAEFVRAIELNGRRDVFYAALAQVYLSKAVTLSQASLPDAAATQNVLARAVNAARLASDNAPHSAFMLANLATMYENAASLLPAARDWAITSVLAARDLEPSNPILAWRLGNNYVLAGNLDKAKEAYQSAIGLKSDYADAYISLAAVYEQTGQLDEAIKTYQSGAASGGATADLVFNWGRLLFNRNKGVDRGDAEKLWQQAVTLAPNYSNAWYSLGLVAESRGDKSLALQYYTRVKELNPANPEILKKIHSLTGPAPAARE